MEFIWYGHACFRLRTRQATVVTDPFSKSLGLPVPSLKAHIVTISHDSPSHNNVKAIKGDYQVVDGPGEYEINDIFIHGIHMRANKKSENGNGVENNAFIIYMDDLVICHLGDLAHIPTQEEVEQMENIDVLLVPVGGHQALNAAQASEVISLLEPDIVIPMHYHLPGLAIELDPVDKFLKEMGVTDPDQLDNLKLGKSNLPEETQVVILNPKL